MPARRALALLAALCLALTTCMFPRDFSIRERVHHEQLHDRLVAAYGADSCLPERVPPDGTTESERPDEEDANHTFVGDVDGMREHVFLHEDGTHSYAERWDVGVPGIDWEILNVGWDWKVECRIERCTLPDGVVCCFQECRDGGDHRMAYEAPDRFGCMNDSAGGIYQWFLDGLAEGGVPGLEGCQ